MKPSTYSCKNCTSWIIQNCICKTMEAFNIKWTILMLSICYMYVWCALDTCKALHYMSMWIYFALKCIQEKQSQKSKIDLYYFRVFLTFTIFYSLYSSQSLDILRRPLHDTRFTCLQMPWSVPAEAKETSTEKHLTFESCLPKSLVQVNGSAHLYTRPVNSQRLIWTKCHIRLYASIVKCLYKLQ